MITRRGFVRLTGTGLTLFGFVDRMFPAQTPAREEIVRMTAAVKPLTPADYSTRRSKAWRLLGEKKLDGFFMEGGPTLEYFMGVRWGRSERTFGAVLTNKETVVWICSRFELERARELLGADQEVRTWEEHDSPYRLIGGVLKDIGGARLGIEPTIRQFILEGLRRDAPHLQLLDGAPVSEGCRAVKSEKELEYLELANRITKIAYKKAFSELREGMEPRDLAAKVGQYHQELGTAGGGWPQFGPNTAFPHGSQVIRTLKDGDVVMVDGGCGIEGYRSDVTRTIVFGKPTDKQKRIADIVILAQKAAFDAVRPGVACGEIDRAARKVIEDSGFGPGYKHFLHRLGHGIGMEGHEYPYLVKDNPLKLEPGMTFSNEPGIYIYGEFGIRTEDCFVVTADGARYFGGMLAAAIDIPFVD